VVDATEKRTAQNGDFSSDVRLRLWARYTAENRSIFDTLNGPAGDTMLDPPGDMMLDLPPPPSAAGAVTTSSPPSNAAGRRLE
jgi:hypothetical protein